MGRAPKRILIVDGYNVINARQDGQSLSGRQPLSDRQSLADARERLVDDLMDYAGYSGQEIVVVFDAWMSDRTVRTEEQRGAVRVVYTQKGEIADRYIERLCDDYAQDIEYRRVEVRVASSDALEQTIILGRGATRLSARELMYEMGQMRQEGIRHAAPVRPVGRRSPIADHLSEEVRRKLDALRKDGNR